ncbi:hypothetical protein FGD67_03695 [Colwellia sp. M166]|uniref:excisionase n=1 Tax=Colwellia sp. M166 TaxID=2583805 RepID=UPI00211EF08C|nr:excisionase [Colwellia sp. M166]UUO22411.1 hypothetical protein FGD67_03695 [Colwellia sp. M166]|tara:strand:+ start:9183 stop:9452 length:270 start_codon:yes stop_codon:yes gene_type:complete
MKQITLLEWAEKNYSKKFGIGTLNKWARNNLITPAPVKIGGSWLVHPNATYVQKTIECKRTEHALKELKQSIPVNFKLNNRTQRIINNG